MTEELTLRHGRVHRVHCIGVCPALEVTAVYPVLDTAGGEPSAAVLRFNEAYRAMAEGWLSWAEGSLLERVTAELEAGGVGAVYRFTRRRATCEMVACEMAGREMAADDLARPTASLTVNRTVSLDGWERGSARRVSEDIWRWPDLTLAVRGTRKMKTGGKGQNTL